MELDQATVQLQQILLMELDQRTQLTQQPTKLALRTALQTALNLTALVQTALKLNVLLAAKLHHAETGTALLGTALETTVLLKLAQM
jgi:hypothetical protein